MTTDDREHWDRRYAESGMASPDEIGPPPVFAAVEDWFPTSGRCLELACGRGRGAVWLARRGMDVWGVDVSPVAVDLARRMADVAGVGERCRFDVVDLDDGLPAGPPVDLILCHKFRGPALDDAIVDRLAPGAMLAIAVLSEVGAGPGRFRAPAGELRQAFAGLEIVAEGEGDGMAWLIGRRR